MAIEVQVLGQKTMTEVSNELIYEVLKQVQQRFDRVDNKVDEIKSEMNALRGHQVSMQQDIHNVYGIFGRFDLRLEHIERRLELNDAAAS
jgi:tetrahydromethanopterin S-methyltransferase subunit G